MEFEEVLCRAGAADDGSNGGAKLPSERLLREQMANVFRKLVVHRIADRADDEERNFSFSAYLSHRKRFHVNGQGLMLLAKPPLFLAEADDAIERKQPPAMEIGHFSQPRYDSGGVKRDFASLGIHYRIGGDEIVLLTLPSSPPAKPEETTSRGR